MQEQWMRWKPIENLEEKYNVDTIFDTNEDRGLIITLYSCKDRTRKVEIIFKDYADSYRHTNESFSLRAPDQLSKTYGKEFYSDWTFFKRVDSEYLAWLAYESCEYSHRFDFIHFCLLCSDSVVDILARYEPTVRHLHQT